MIEMGSIFDTHRASRGLWIILGFALALPGASRAVAQDLRTAELTPGTVLLREADLPPVLTPADITRYEHIFALQDKAHWQDADREIGRLNDKLLLGAVLAQRYRNNSYHARYGELVQWLDRYADQPDAKTIYALALNRHTKGAPLPPKPLAAPVFAGMSDELGIAPHPTDLLLAKRDHADLVPAALHRAAALRDEIRSLATD